MLSPPSFAYGFGSYGAVCAWEPAWAPRGGFKLTFRVSPLNCGGFSRADLFPVMTFRAIAFLLFLLASSFANLQAQADEQVLNGIAAVVNSDVITFSEVEEMVGPREKALEDQQLTGKDLADKVKALRLQAVQVLIDNKLIIQEFAKNKYSIPDYIVDQQVEARRKEISGNDRQAFIRTLMAQGMSMDRFRSMVRDEIIVQAMRQESVKNDTIIAPGAIQKYYREHTDEFSTRRKSISA